MQSNSSSSLSICTSSSSHSSHSRKGRPSSTPSKLFRLFKCTKSEKCPKLENLRAYFIRLVRKMARLTIEGKRSNTFLIKFSRNPEHYSRAQEILNANIELAIEIGLKSTDADPTKRSARERSFNSLLVRSFYSYSFVSELHDWLVMALLDRPNMQQIEDAMGITVKETTPDSIDWTDKIVKLMDYLKTDDFKGQNLEKRDCEENETGLREHQKCQLETATSDDLDILFSS